jgi:hypothetical protein
LRIASETTPTRRESPTMPPAKKVPTRRLWACGATCPAGKSGEPGGKTTSSVAVRPDPKRRCPSERRRRSAQMVPRPASDLPTIPWRSPLERIPAREIVARRTAAAPRACRRSGARAIATTEAKRKERSVRRPRVRRRAARRSPSATAFGRKLRTAGPARSSRWRATIAPNPSM